MQETQEMRVRSLGWKDPLEDGMATHSRILAWRIPMDRGAWRATVHGVTKSRTRLKRLSTHASCTTQISFPFQSEAVYSLEKAASAPVCSSLPTNV